MPSNNPGAELKVIGLDLESPTKDFTKGPAMSWAVFLDAIERGMAQVDEDVDLVCVGEMEIGNWKLEIQLLRLLLPMLSTAATRERGLVKVLA